MIKSQSRCCLTHCVKQAAEPQNSVTKLESKAMRIRNEWNSLDSGVCKGMHSDE